MKKRYLFILALLFQMTFNGFGKGKEPNQQADERILQAEKLFKQGDINSSLDIYLEAALADPKNYQLNFMTGECYLSTRHKILGAEFYLKAYKIDSISNPELLYKMGLCYQMGFNFDEAKKYFIKYQNRISNPKYKGKNLGDDMFKVDKRLQECVVGKSFYENPNPHFTIDNAGPILNSIYDDYVPCVTSEDKIMIFTSRREGGMHDKKDKDNGFFEDIWVSNKNANGIWSKPQILEGLLNTQEHDASISLSSDGKKLFIRKDKNGGDIFVSDFVNNAWSAPKSMGDKINTPKFNEPSLCIAPDGKTVYFSSNKPGGFGGFDLYKSTITKDGNWTEPENLGSKINTEYDEDAPYIDAKNHLFFSSTGHQGMGGYDIYTAKYQDLTKTFSEPKNLGYPINSPEDDIYLVISGDGKTGYFSTERGDGFGERDIYKFTITTEHDILGTTHSKKHIVHRKTDDFESNSFANKSVIKGVVKDNVSNQAVEAKVYIFDANDNLVSTANVDKNGQFTANVPMDPDAVYSMTISKKGYLPETFSNIKYDNVKKKFTDVNIKASKIVAGQSINVDHIYFEKNKALIKETSFGYLDVLADWLTENIELKIEIGGYTDNVGNEFYNKSLSKKRASAVMLYLVAKEIHQDRFSVIGYGQDNPIADNQNEEGRAKNRRTEFKIIKN